MLPKVSIIIPCYNNEAYLSEAVNSCLIQDYKNLEVIFIDDGSSDNSWEKATQIEDSRLLVLKQENKGACAARNAGLARATGTYVKFLDADDILAPNCISRQVEQTKLVDAGSIVFGYCHNFIGSVSNTRPFPKVIRHVDDNFAVTLVLKTILTSCSLYPIEHLKAVNGFDETVTSRQEWALNLKLFLSGFQFSYFDTLVQFRRLHDSVFQISNRRHIAETEMNNLNNIFESLPPNLDPDYLAAWSYIYWRAGRYILLGQGKAHAMQFFNRAKQLSPRNYKKYWPKSYRLATSLLGLYLPDKLVSTLQHKRLNYAYAKHRSENKPSILE